MKKSSFVGACLLLLGIGLWGNPMEVEAEHYYYLDTPTVSGNDSISVGKWYEGGMVEMNMLEGMPENVTAEDMFSINATPDEECAQWLKNLSGELGDFHIFLDRDVEIQIGSPEKELHALNICNDGGIVTFYGDLDSLWTGYGDSKDGQNWGGTTIVHGDIGGIHAGMTGTYDFPMNLNGKVQVNGNVGEFTWVKTMVSETLENTYYSGFVGDINISGTLGSGKIQEIVYDSSVQRETWQVTGQIGSCGANEFAMMAGVLSEKVVVTAVEPELGNYYFMYRHYHGDGVNGAWTRYAYNKTTDKLAFYDDCKLEDIPNGADVGIFSTPKALTLDINLNTLSIANSDNGYPLDVTVNGNVNELHLEIFNMSSSDVNISGDVDKMITVYRYNPEANVTLNGKIKDGEYQNSRGVVQGYFTAENMPIIIAGEWNPALFMYTSKEGDAIGYAPIENETIFDVLAGSNIGEEVKISTGDGEKTLVKAAEVLIQKTQESVMEQLEQKEELQDSLEALKEMLRTEAESVKEALPVCAVDININTYFADKDTGDKYWGDANYGTEAVTSLEQGRSLEFTVKVPAEYFDAKAKYSIIREHFNADGTSVMDVLETIQNGDLLTFASDKFSTFVIVKAEMEDASVIPTPAPTTAPVVTPAPTTAPVATPTNAESSKVTLEPVTYTVQRGDTLSTIAYKHGLRLRELLALNPQIKNPNLIYCKQVIVVGMEQSEEEENAQIPLGAEQYYTVEKGDSLYKIAKEHKMQLRDLASLNRVLIRQKYIYAGQRVRIK